MTATPKPSAAANRSTARCLSMLILANVLKTVATCAAGAVTELGLLGQFRFLVCDYGTFI